jgi:prepilin peptidase CpaA
MRSNYIHDLRFTQFLCVHILPDLCAASYCNWPNMLGFQIKPDTKIFSSAAVPLRSGGLDSVGMDIRLDEICLASAVAVGIVGAICDMRPSHRIPNQLTYTALLGGIALRGFLGGWHELLSAFASVVVMFIFTFILYNLNSMGGGDVKLMTALAAYVALPHVFMLILWTSISGGVIGVAFVTWKGQFRKRMANSLSLVTHHLSDGLAPHPELNLESADALKMPYGPAIALGSIAVLIIARGQ